MTALSRQRIVDAARLEVERDGHEALSLRSLARALGVTAPAFYDHVSSRDDIIRGVAEQGYAAMVETYDVEGHRAIDRCRARAHAYVQFARDHPELFRTMFLYRPAAVELETDNELAAANATFAMGLEDLATAMDDGDLAVADPTHVNLVLWAAVHGVATVSLMAPPVGDAVAAEVIDAVFAGLAPPSGR